MGFSLILILITASVIFNLLSPTYGYDSLDPNGNITIKWDLRQENDGRQDVLVSIYNYQLFRHIESPGWKLKWKWSSDEVIWDMRGAEATKQGDCSRFLGKSQLPHSCEREPVIVDLLPGAHYNLQVQNCCKGGVLSSFTQDPENAMAAFQMNSDSNNNSMPYKFKIGIPGYTCGNATRVPPSKFYMDNGRRQTQALGTWNITCTYSPFLASSAPKCCVSLSSFYSEAIVPCPVCSCACQGERGSNCVRHDQLHSVLRLPQNEQSKPLVQCSPHMCPVRVHWHVKLSYKDYWRVKITINNLNVVKNYSQWNLVVLHPNLQSLAQVFSFYYKPLNQYASINDSGVFYGIEHYNDMLLQSGDGGNVQTEMLLHKDHGIFTFKGGWAFPRKVIFNGDECVMPSPNEYPMLPNSSPISETSNSFFVILLVLASFVLL